MNKKIFTLTICFSLVSCTVLLAQNWKIGGNNLDSNSRFGSTNKKNILFVADGKAHAILTKDGLWGFGTSSPNTKVHINSEAGQNPFRVQVDGASKLYVDNGGGVSVGSSAIPPANGLFVSGNAGIGTSSPTEKLHVVGNIFATGNIDVGGTVGFGSVETFSDGGSFTIQSNSDIVPDADATGNLGTTARTWASVHAISYLTTASKTAKNTAENLKAGLSEIMKLRPVSYKDGSSNKFGFFASEVQEILPEVTSDREYSVIEAGGKVQEKKVDLSLEYDAFIPVLIKGMQDQQKLIEAMQEKITQLETALASTGKSGVIKNSTATFNENMLEQNQPNPFNQNTVIRYHLPSNTAGKINVYDNNGKLLKTFTANETGQVMLSGGDLKAGTYSYTLSINGKLAGSKQLVIIK